MILLHIASFTRRRGVERKRISLMSCKLLNPRHAFFDQRELVPVNRYHQAVALIAECCGDSVATAERSDQFLEIRGIQTLHISDSIIINEVLTLLLLFRRQYILAHLAARVRADVLIGYSAAHSIVIPSVVHSTQQYENNRAEVSHQPTRQRGVISRLSPFDLHRRLLGGLPRP
jgi:hypothetical protein